MWFPRSLLVLVALIAPAIAQPAPPVDVGKVVDAGLAFQKSGDFAGAVEMYEKANQASPHPVLLFNIAQAHRLWSASLKDKDPENAAKHRDLARENYKKFLESNPEGDVEVTARGQLAKLDKEYDEAHPKEEAARRDKEAAAREAAIKLEQDKLAADRHAKATRDAEEQKHVTAAVSEQQLSKARTVKIVGLSVMGAGVVATGVGVVFGLKARSLSNDLTDKDVYDPAKIDKGNQDERYMTISYIAGGALLVGGLATWWVGRGIGETALEHVAIAPTANGDTMVMVHGAF